jgi:hypothetical protein
MEVFGETEPQMMTRTYIKDVVCDACGKSCKLAGTSLKTFGQLRYEKQGDANSGRRLDLCVKCTEKCLRVLALTYDLPLREPATDEQRKAREMRRAEKGPNYFGP